MDNLQQIVEQNFTCEICEKAFSTKKNKDQHVTIVHGEVKKFDCNVCDKKFGKNLDLVIHIQNNHQAKDKKCDFCAKRFANFGRLSNHIKTIHESQSKYECDSCAKSLSTLGN